MKKKIPELYSDESIKEYNEEMHFLEEKDLYTISEDETDDYEKWYIKNTKQPLYRSTNIYNDVILFYSDEELLEYARMIYEENEKDQPYPSEIHWMPENLQQAKEYIHEYCDNLNLEELDETKTTSPDSN